MKPSPSTDVPVSRPVKQAAVCITAAAALLLAGCSSPETTPVDAGAQSTDASTTTASSTTASSTAESSTTASSTSESTTTASSTAESSTTASSTSESSPTPSAAETSTTQAAASDTPEASGTVTTAPAQLRDVAPDGFFESSSSTGVWYYFTNPSRTAVCSFGGQSPTIITCDLNDWQATGQPVRLCGYYGPSEAERANRLNWGEGKKPCMTMVQGWNTWEKQSPNGVAGTPQDVPVLQPGFRLDVGRGVSCHTTDQEIICAGAGGEFRIGDAMVDTGNQP